MFQSNRGARSRSAAILVLTLLFLSATLEGGGGSESDPPESTRLLSRKKRYLVFPEGAGLSVVYCLTWGTYLATDLFTFGTTLGIGYELPTDTKAFLSEKPSAELHRKDRRDVYTKLQVLLDSRGMDGRACVLRAVCEAASRVHQGSFLDTVLRAIFTFPLSEGELGAGGGGEDEHRDLDDAQWRGWTNSDCGQTYPECSTSLFNLAFEQLQPLFS